MQISKNALDVLKRLEGEKLIPYKCSAGVPTIGYGSTKYEDGTPVKIMDKPITKTRAEELLKHTVKAYENCVNRVITREMTQAQFDAFVLMCYNCGVGAFSRPAVVAKCFNTGEDREMRVWWLKSFVTVNGGKEPLTGLVNRRKHELRIFTDGDY